MSKKIKVQTNDHPGMDARWISQQFCLFISKAARENGITHEMIANETGVARPNVTRFLSGSHVPTLQTVIRIAAAVGVKIQFTNDLPDQNIDVVESGQFMNG